MHYAQCTMHKCAGVRSHFLFSDLHKHTNTSRMNSFSFLVASMLVITVQSTTLESTATEGKPAPRPVCNTTNWSAEGVACLMKYKTEHECERCVTRQFPIWCAAEVERDQACVVQFQENCTLWQSQTTGNDNCVCQRSEESFPNFPLPNVTCVRLGGGCFSQLVCKRGNESFGGEGCFGHLPWPMDRKRCSPNEPEFTSNADQSVAAHVLMSLVVALATMV
jgi:hypothetical protein